MKNHFYQVFAFILLTGSLLSQSKAPYFSYKSGLGFATPDSSYSLNIRFRIQNRALMNTVSDEDFEPASFEARVRRCRLILAGHMLNPKLSYYIQFSFARGDMDWSVTDATTQNVSPNVVRDGMIFYRPVENLQLGFGQGKLPGNRQRINSSSALQFYDRSLVNANFTTDRDFGFFINYALKSRGQLVANLKGAVTSGEGRNSNQSNYGLAYTGRIELLPLGAFTDNGDFFEGDVIREPKPKLSIAGGYMFNDMAVRTGGQLGKDLYGEKSFNLYFADMVVKYRGFCLLSEYMRRDANTPYVLGSDNKIRFIPTGEGINNQLSYCFKNMFELALRQTLVTPHKDVKASFNQAEQYGVGLSKYLNKHKVKVQFNVLYTKEKNLANKKDLGGFYTAVFQVELGI